MKDAELSERIDRVARRQHGLISARQLRKLGLSDRQISYMAAVGHIEPVRKGAYRFRGSPLTWRTSVMAAVLAAGADAVASHRTAGRLWGLVDSEDAGGLIELIVRTQRRLPGVCAHRMRLNPKERTTRDGIPVTSPARTLLDLAASTGAEELGRLVDAAWRRRLATSRELREMVERHAGHGRRRMVPIQEALADRLPGYDPGANDWERERDRMWERMGLPPAERQYRVRIGGRSFRLDRALPDLKIAVEWNGFEHHGSRSAFDRDSDRRALLAAAGWLCLDFTSRSEPEFICRTVLEVVEGRTRLLRSADTPRGGRTIR
jgi:predicted transcriptional regulator of viral defense system/very-short-patch-repair endonuclease